VAPIPPWGPFGDMLLNVGTAVFLIAGLVEVAFLVHYVIVAPAFRSWIGWMFVIRSVSFLLSGVAIMLGRILGPMYAARPYVTLVLYLAVLASALITYATFLYERYRRTNPRRTTPSAPGSFARRAMGLLSGNAKPREDASGPDSRAARLVEDRP
jgi:hypothetical protein